MRKQGLHRHCKSLRTSFSKLQIKIPSLHRQTPSSRRSKPTGGATSGLLSACKCPKTPSFAADDRDHEPVDLAGATLSDVDRFLYENFQSLYAAGRNIDKHETDRPAADVIRPSRRFFASPGTSSSVVEDARQSRASPSTTSSSLSLSGGGDGRGKLLGEGVPVVTISRDPYDDIRRSMKEMVEARHDATESCRQMDWEFMEELLFCYLELNDRSVRKYILEAFTDLIVDFRGKDQAAAGKRVLPSRGKGMSKRTIYSKADKVSME